MRVSTACAACRSRRRKCEVPSGASSCTYCADRKIPCTKKTAVALSPPTHYARSLACAPASDRMTTMNGVGAGTVGSHGGESPKTVGVQLPPLPLVLELVALYFDFIHDQFHSLFHRPSFLEDVLHERVPPVILNGMMAMSARFSTNATLADVHPWDRGKPFAQEAVRLFDLREISLTTVQAAVILGATMRVTEGESSAESVYYAVACRVASLLDLPNRPAADSIEREVNIRVWWTLWRVDVWASAGVGLPTQMSHPDKVPLPIDETEFLSLRRGEPPRPTDNTDHASSLLAQMIILNRILMEINQVIRAVSTGSNSLVLEESVKDLSQKLDTWHSTLPSYMADTPENLNRYASQGLGRIFVAVWLGYYNFGQQLFYQFLHEDAKHSNSVGGTNIYAQKCKDHAANLCRIIYAASSTPGADVLYSMVGHLTVIASTVQIHTLLFGTDDEEIRAARLRLERNFEMLIRLRKYWPTLEGCFARLRSFHEVCRKSMDTSFRMDQWMLRFLSEFVKPIEEKTDEEPLSLDPWSVDNIGISPQNWV